MKKFLTVLFAGLTLTVLPSVALEQGEEASLPRLLKAGRYSLISTSLPEGTKVLIAFYSASWCAPCVIVGKDLESRYDSLKKKYPQIEFFTFPVESNALARAEYLRAKHFPWLAADPTARDSDDWDFALPGGTPQFQAFSIAGDQVIALTPAASFEPVLKAAIEFLTTAP